MPAAAVIPALIAYINVVAVKKPVVGFEITVWFLHLMTSVTLCSTSRQFSLTCGIVQACLRPQTSL